MVGRFMTAGPYVYDINTYADVRLRTAAPAP